MGKQIEENIVDSLEDMLGFGSDDTNNNNQSLSNDDKNIIDDATTATSKTEENKTEENKKSSTDSQVVEFTSQQQDTAKELAKISVKLEDLEKTTVDTDDFYASLDDILTDEEQQLEYDDKKAYLKLVAKKEKEYIESKSNIKEIEALKEKQSELSRIYDRQVAIISMVKKYPNYDHDKVEEFYKQDLTQKEQEKILGNAKSFEDVYENTFKLYLEKNPSNIQSVQTPNIPNINNMRKQTVDAGVLKDGLKSADEELQEALGL